MSDPITAVTVSVHYHDVLAITLPRNCRHFDRMVVITSPDYKETMRVVADCNHGSDIELVVTDAFYRGGCPFNKGAAIAEVVKSLAGWVCHVDADTLLPDDASFTDLDPTCLYSAYRKMLTDPSRYTPDLDWSTLPDGPERRNGEYAGYIQVWHSSLGLEYPSNWIHAGGSDSEFCYGNFTPDKRRRLPFTVLHLGVDGLNWAGRVSRFMDGTMPPEAERRAEMLRGIKMMRSLNRNYDAEKLK